MWRFPAVGPFFWSEPLAPPVQSEGCISFGEFELDRRTAELRRNGLPLKLQPQPARVLVILASRAGEVVTRQELAAQVWGADTYVDFEHGLNFAIRQIRSVLQDDAENPRYLETVTKRGYRFIAPVKFNGHVSPQEVPATSTALPEGDHRNRRLLVFGAIATVVLIALAAFWYARRDRGPTNRPPIVIGGFVNRTGDSVFDQALREGLSVQLEQSPYLRFISDEQVRETLLLMRRPANSDLTPELAREVCQRVNAAVTFGGSIDLIGSRYALTLRATECATGEVLASAQSEANDKSHVLDAVTKLAAEMRVKLGEPLSSVRQYNVPLASVTTSSLEALRCYTEGIQSLARNFDYTEAISWFQKAIELDPSFAAAYWAIGDSYAVLGETKLAADYTRKAFELRERVSVREKALIEANYYYYVLGDVERARRSCEFLSKLYTFNADTHNSLAVFAESVGKFDVGLAEYKEALRLAPERSFLYRDVAYTYLIMERAAEAAEVVKSSRKPDLDADLATLNYSLAFYRGDREDMTRQLAAAAAQPEVENLLLAMEADTAAYGGELRKARALSRRAAESASRTGRKETAAMYEAVAALREAMYGNPALARQWKSSEPNASMGRDVIYAQALAFLYAGDAKRGQALTDEIGRRFPEDTVVNCNYMPALRARLALLRADSQAAIEILSHTGQCEFGVPVYSYYNWPNLYPAYVRGEAYLAANRAPEAAAEFEKIIAHRGLVLNEPIGALAQLQLGRAYKLAGDIAKSRAAYEHFLSLWKQADADVPLYNRAKVEFSNLQK